MDNQIPIQYSANISFTYVDEINLENESPGSCVITSDMFHKLFRLAFNECELVSCVENDKSFQIEFITSKDFKLLMLELQVFRFKVRGKLSKIADIMINRI